MTGRPRISIKPTAAPRDPRRRPVRGRSPVAPPQAQPQRAPPAQPQRTPQAQPKRAPPAPPERARPLPASLHGDGVRVSKLLAERAMASRREADEWIDAGWVKVDGRVAVLGERALPDARIELDPRARDEQARRVTILLHKPIGYVSGQAEDGHEPASVLVRAENRWSGDRSRQRFHPGQLRGLAPAGYFGLPAGAARHPARHSGEGARPSLDPGSPFLLAFLLHG